MPFKRPFAAIGAAVILSLLIFGTTALWIACAVVGAVFAIASVRMRRAVIILLCVYLAAGGWAMLRFGITDSRTARLDGENAYIRGYICELPEKGEYGTYCTLRFENVTASGESFDSHEKAGVRLDGDFEAEAYDRITLSAKVRAVPAAEASDGAAYKLTALSAPRVVGKAPRTPYYYCLKLKEYMLGRLSSEGDGERSGLLPALLLGDKSGVSQDTQLAFRKCGVSHLTAVSGLHIVTITMFVFEILRRLLRRPPILVPLLLVWTLAALTAFSASAVRAAFMLSVVFCADLFGRESDALNSLGFAATVMCLVSPSIIGDVGFLLSVSATAGLILLAPRLSRKLTKLMHVSREKTPLPLYAAVSGVAEVIGQSLAAWIATLPVTVLVFGSVSLIAPIANLLTVTPAAITITLGFPAALLPFVGGGFLRLALVGSDWLTWITEKLAELPFSYTYVKYPYMLAAVIAAAAAVFFVKRGMLRVKLALPLALSVLMCGVCADMYISPRMMRIDSVFVGNARADFVSCGGKRVLYVAGLGKDDCGRVVSRAGYVGISDADYIVSGDAFSADAAHILSERLKADGVMVPESVAANGCKAVSEAESDLGGAKLTLLSSGTRLDMYAECGNVLTAFTGGNRLNSDCDAVFAPVGFDGEGVLVTGVRSEYYAHEDGETLYTCDDGVLEFYCNGADMRVMR